MLTIRIMNKRLFLLTIGLVSAAFCFAQGTRRLTINGVFDLIEQNSTSLREQKTGIESAAEGVKDAKSQRLPDIGTQLGVISWQRINDRPFLWRRAWPAHSSLG